MKSPAGRAARPRSPKLSCTVRATGLSISPMVAYGINTAGQVVGAGSIGGEDHAFLLTPIPTRYTVIELPLKTGNLIPNKSLRINSSGQAAGESLAGHAA